MTSIIDLHKSHVTLSSDLPIHTIGKELSKNSRLTSLSIDNVSFHKNFPCVDEDSFTTLQTLFSTCTTLRSLQLNYFTLDDAHVTALSEALALSNSLKSLHVESLHLLIDTVGYSNFCKNIARITTLTNLNLSYNSHSGLSYFFLGLKECCNLRTLNFSGLTFSQLDTEHLCRLVASSRALTDLDITCVCLHDVGANTIAKTLALNPALTRLNLSLNGINAINSLAEALVVNTVLQRLELHRNNLGNDGGESLGAVLKINSTLKLLNLNSCHFDRIGIVHLFDGLLENKGLTSLDLRGSQIWPENVESLVSEMNTSTTITDLGISISQLSENTVKPIADSIRGNTTITSLMIDCIRLEQNIAASIIESVAMNTTLIQFGLTAQIPQEDGALLLSKVLSCNTTLRHLTFHQVKMKPDSVKLLSPLFRENSSLESVILLPIDLGEEEAEMLSRGLFYSTLQTRFSLTTKHRPPSMVQIDRISHRNFVNQSAKRATLLQLLLNVWEGDLLVEDFSQPESARPSTRYRAKRPRFIQLKTS